MASLMEGRKFYQIYDLASNIALSYGREQKIAWHIRSYGKIALILIKSSEKTEFDRSAQK